MRLEQESRGNNAKHTGETAIRLALALALVRATLDAFLPLLSLAVYACLGNAIFDTSLTGPLFVTALTSPGTVRTLYDQK